MKKHTDLVWLTTTSGFSNDSLEIQLDHAPRLSNYLDVVAIAQESLKALGGKNKLLSVSVVEAIEATERYAEAIIIAYYRENNRTIYAGTIYIDA